MNLKSILPILAVGCLAILIFLFWKDCNTPPVIDTRAREVDSLSRVNDSLRHAHETYTDSMRAVLNRAYYAIDEFAQAKVEAEMKAGEATRTAQHYARLYDDAKSHRDTVAQLQACDSLRWSLDSLIIRSRRQDVAADSLINELWQVSITKDRIIQHQEEQLRVKDQIIDSTVAAFQRVDAAYLKLIRKRKSFWTKLNDIFRIAVPAAGGYMLGHYMK
jgi:hypothetical protein